MGLDMWIFRITQLTEDDKKKVDNGDVSEYTEFFLSDVENEGLYRHIKDLLYIKTKNTEYWDYDKIKKFFNIPEDAKCVLSSSSSDGSFTWHFVVPNRNSENTYSINSEDIPKDKEKELKSTKEEIVGYAKEQEIGYWRKDYKLQNKMYENCDYPIENCGYYPLNADMRKILLKDRKNIFAKQDLEDRPGSRVFYHEWY